MIDLSLKALLDKSTSLQQRYYGDDPDIAQKLAAGLVKNAAELVAHPSWLSGIVDGTKDDARSALLACIDCLIYSLSIAGTTVASNSDFSPDIVMSLIVARQEMVQHLHETCTLLDSFSLSNKDIVVLDIDGVLFPWPDVWDRFYADCGVLDRKSAKELYRTSGIKAVTPPIAGAQKLFDFLRNAGKTIAVISSRPVGRYPEVYMQTMEFFRRYGMEPDLCLFSENKHISKGMQNLWPGVRLFVDDEHDRIVHMKREYPHIFCVHIENSKETPRISTTSADLVVSSTMDLYNYLEKNNDIL